MNNKNTPTYIDYVINGQFEALLNELVEDVSLLAVLQDCANILYDDEYPAQIKCYAKKLHNFACQAVDKWHRERINALSEEHEKHVEFVKSFNHIV